MSEYAFCNLCTPSHRVELESLREHLKVVHDFDLDDVEEWPDGSPVIIDLTLEPEDFTS